MNFSVALYNDADIVLLDDPLSAVDAHVGQHIFNEAILGLKARGKTVVLVTHALHMLPQVDYVYTMVDGQIAEAGTYNELLAREGGAFSRLMQDFGGAKTEKQEEQLVEQEEIAIETAEVKKATSPVVKLTKKLMGKAAGTGKLEGRLMVSEGELGVLWESAMSC